MLLGFMGQQCTVVIQLSRQDLVTYGTQFVITLLLHGNTGFSTGKTVRTGCRSTFNKPKSHITVTISADPVMSITLRGKMGGCLRAQVYSAFYRQKWGGWAILRVIPDRITSPPSFWERHTLAQSLKTFVRKLNALRFDCSFNFEY